jgi:hypothetical protein
MAKPPRLRAALLVLAAAAVATVPGTATSATAAGCRPVIDKVTVRDVVINQTGKSTASTTVTAHDPCSDGSSAPRVVRVTGQAFLSDGSWWDVTYAASGSSWAGSSGARFAQTSALGRGQQVVEVTDSEGNTTYRDTLPFYVRRDVQVSSFGAAPEPVTKGAYVTVSGLVRRLSVSSTGKAAYVNYTAHAVDYYFRPLTSKTYTKVGSTKSSSTGRFSARFRATVDGCWKVQSTQTSQHLGRWSSADCVDVR